MAMIDVNMTVLLIICYVFGILTAGAIYLMVVTPLARRKYDKEYNMGFMDGMRYVERVKENDYLSV